MPFLDAARRALHFKKHGHDFGPCDELQYEAKAEAFFALPVGYPVHEFVRQDGSRDRVRFNEATDEFGLISADGMIVTYFRPDPAEHGKRTNLIYFWEQ